MQVELVYEKTCPNIEAARSHLLRAFAEAGIQPRWQEWEVNMEHLAEVATRRRALPSMCDVRPRAVAVILLFYEPIMSKKRQIEIFSADCPVCQDTADLVNRLACTSCEISVLDMNDKKVAARATGLGIRSVPAVAVNGKLADCCTGRGVDENTLRAAGIGRPLA